MRIAMGWLVVLGIAVVVAGSGFSSSSSGAAAKPHGLVGTWRTTNVCRALVRALAKAGVDKKVAKGFIFDGYPGQVAGSSDPCHGARPMKHSHRFGADGSFASFDQHGRQVDGGKYKRVDGRTFTLDDPPVAVHYRIDDGNKATFSVVLPRCKTMRCELAKAHVVSAFFPRTYTRIG